MDRRQDACESFDGWDNMVVRDPGLPATTEVIDRLVTTGAYTSALGSPGPAEG
ncbi:hypothetical protein [Streptomyces sp. NPDC046859]|uniref:hypothetical protein n=1 Tax=Streptomyces sp. NPDC046859 TaxID=3155734 RepID=UPI0033C982B3